MKGLLYTVCVRNVAINNNKSDLPFLFLCEPGSTLCTIQGDALFKLKVYESK